MASIYRGNIKRWDGKISPASVHGSRVAMKDENNYFVASGNEVLHLQPTFPVPNESDVAALGKTGLPVPITISQMNENLIHTPHLHEIHSIIYDEFNNDSTKGRLGCIDGYGCASITPITDDNNKLTNIVLPPAHDFGRAGDSGWAGLAFDPKNENIVVTSHLPSKTIAIYDIQASGGPKIIKRLQGLNSPTAIKVLDDGNTLLSLEYNQLAVTGVCEKRAVASTTWLYGMATGVSIGKGVTNGVVAVGGASRTLSVYDMRKWAVCASWSNCLKFNSLFIKHSIRTVHFSTVHTDLVYVGGIDAEVIVGPWMGGGTASHFTCLRVDARWIGLSAHAGKASAGNEKSDAIFGVTAHASAYFVRDPAHMYDRAKDVQAAHASHPHPLSYDEGSEVEAGLTKRVKGSKE